MTRKRFTVRHWKRTKSKAKEGNAACRPDLRVPLGNTTHNVDEVTCKVCRKHLGLP